MHLPETCLNFHQGWQVPLSLGNEVIVSPNDLLVNSAALEYYLSLIRLLVDLENSRSS